jgi:hypothetical protein
MLNELDKEMEGRGFKWVRYADDFSIYCTDEAQARQSGNAIYCFLRDKLQLPINRDKSGIRRPADFTTLGYSFKAQKQKGKKGQYSLLVSEKGWRGFKKKLKDITRKTTPGSIANRTRQLNSVQRGWLEYYRMAGMKKQLEKIDRWIRTRLRCCVWHNWKKPKRRGKNLIRLGVEPVKARKWGNSGKGSWAIAHSQVMKTTVTLERLRQRGYQAMLPIYEKINPYLNEPLYT